MLRCATGLSLLRFVRIFRVLRLFRRLRSLRMIINALTRAILPVGNACVPTPCRRQGLRCDDGRMRALRVDILVGFVV
eukprot:1585425-Rhodomonas_salina.1